MDTTIAGRRAASAPHHTDFALDDTSGAQSSQPLLLTLPEVAAQLRCTRRSIERQVARRQLHVVRIGRAVRVERRELDRFLRALREAGDGG